MDQIMTVINSLQFIVATLFLTSPLAALAQDAPYGKMV